MIFNKIIKKLLEPKTVLILLLLVFSGIYTMMLFGDGDMLAGGDNYVYLTLRKREIKPYLYLWDRSIPFGGRTHVISDVLGLPLYSYIFSFIPVNILQRLIIMFLYFFKFYAFIKLAKLLSEKLSYFAIIPSLLIFTLNAYETLNPFPFFPLMYNVYLPLSLYVFIKMFKSNNLDVENLTKLTLLSVVFSPINSNIPLAITIFIPQVLYVLLFIRSVKKAQIINMVGYTALLAVANLWWFVPLAAYYFETSKEVFASGWFVAISTGSIQQNLRMIGQWAWYSKSFLYYYYPFNKYYDNPIVMFSAFFVVAVAFLQGLRSGLNLSEKKNRLLFFFLLLALVSLFLVGGARPPFGVLYELIFNYVPFFKVFREPFTKFGELYVLSIAVLFYAFLSHIQTKLPRNKQVICFVIAVGIAIINIKPALFAEHIVTNWNGNGRTFRIEIPDYWRDFEKYALKHFKDTRLIAIPKSYYGTAWNWINGFTSADDVSVNFITRKNNIIRNPLATNKTSSDVIDSIYKNSDVNPKFIGLLGINYVLRENDLDWRYGGALTTSPTETDMLVAKLDLEKIASFGDFSKKYLSRIQNEEINENLRFEFPSEVLNRAPIELYKLKNDYILPKLYSVNNIIFAGQDSTVLSSVTSLNEYSKNSGIYIYNDNSNLNSNLPDYNNTVKNASLIFIPPQRRVAKLNYDENSWNTGWLWPNVSIDPKAIEYKLIPTKEMVELLFVGKQFDRRVDKLIWFASKRVAEIARYNPSPDDQDQLIDHYCKNVQNAVSIMEQVPEDDYDDSYWGAASKTLSYMRESNKIFVALNVSTKNKCDPEKMYDEFKKWIDSISNPNCKKYCFEATVPTSGEYTISMNKETLNKYDVTKIVYEIVDNASGQNKTIEYKVSDANNIWTSVGKVALEKDKVYTINLNLPEEKNLFAEGEWQLSEGVYDINNFDITLQSSKLIPGFNLLKEYATANDNKDEQKVIIWNNQINYKQINSWEKGRKYKISFDFDVQQGGLVFSIVEDQPNFSDKYLAGDSSEILKSEIASKLLTKSETGFRKKSCNKDGACLYHYETIIAASKNAVNAYLYVYAFLQDGNVAGLKMQNLRIEEVLEPDIALIKNSTIKALSLVNIKFDEINPTKYNVDVSNSSDKFILLFNESYHKDWVLRHNGKVISENKHYKINGFANSWFIEPSDIENKTDYTLSLEFEPQKTLYIYFLLSGTLILYCIGYNILDMIKRKR